jgi:carboxypeptidase C (cathepsin A)
MLTSLLALLLSSVPSFAVQEPTPATPPAPPTPAPVTGDAPTTERASDDARPPAETAQDTAKAEAAKDKAAQEEAAKVGAEQDAAAKDEAAKAAKLADARQEVVRTQHKLTLEGRELGYTATAGRMKLTDEAGKAKAELFYVAYVLDGVADAAQRPITFAFNGGPGSSSVWLHLGAFGPKRVKMTAEGWAPPPPYELVDNAHSLLDVTDLVFIDPVTTGYSRAAEGENAAQFHGVTPDVEWVAEFIRLYTSRELRWPSPKFLAGESYGTTRAAALAGHLQERHGMYLNGIVLVSAILNFQTARFDVGNDLPYVLFLPTYAATAWHHKRVSREYQNDLRAFLDEVERFAIAEYMPALARGDALSGAERERLVARLGRYTGLSLEFIERCNLRIEIGRFTKELLRDERRTVGRLDSRFKGIDLDAAGERYEYDPSMSAILGPYTATINDYVRRTLKYENDLPYEILTGRVQPWKYDQENRYLNVAETLRRAMTRNPYLKVFVASGYYDFATPYFASDYTFQHLGLDASLRGGVTFGYYTAGHMMYIHEGELARLKRDLVNFVGAATKR